MVKLPGRHFLISSCRKKIIISKILLGRSQIFNNDIIWVNTCASIRKINIRFKICLRFSAHSQHWPFFNTASTLFFSRPLAAFSMIKKRSFFHKVSRNKSPFFIFILVQAAACDERESTARNCKLYFVV